MFWKNADFSRFSVLSLSIKFMLFYSVSTIGLLSALCFSLYKTFESYIPNDVLEKCCDEIIITLAISAIVAIIMSYLLTRQGLKKIRAFENKIEKVTSTSLHERININEWPKELKNLGTKFNKMLDRLQVSFEQLSQFSSDIAHELRTPIHNLRGLTEIALTKKFNSDEHQKMLEMSMDEYLHLSKLIENLLFLARSDHGQIKLKRETIVVQEEILNICDYYQGIADENNIELICIGDASLSVDTTLFKRVISNLLSNALRYTQPHGKITITIRSSEQYVGISIQDTGQGIAEEHLTKIFDRFFRVDSSRTSHSGGVGLGLAIAKSIIDLHQGKITIESKPMMGTTVYLQLPF